MSSKLEVKQRPVAQLLLFQLTIQLAMALVSTAKRAIGL